MGLMSKDNNSKEEMWTGTGMEGHQQEPTADLDNTEAASDSVLTVTVAEDDDFYANITVGLAGRLDIMEHGNYEAELDVDDVLYEDSVLIPAQSGTSGNYGGGGGGRMTPVNLSDNSMKTGEQRNSDFPGSATACTSISNTSLASCGSGDGYGNPQQHKKLQLLVGNLTWWTSDRDLLNCFENINIDVNDVDIKMFENRANGQSKGYCVVTVGSQYSQRTLFEKLTKQVIHGQNPVVGPYSKQMSAQFEAQALAKSGHTPPSQQNSAGNGGQICGGLAVGMSVPPPPGLGPPPRGMVPMNMGIPMQARMGYARLPPPWIMMTGQAPPRGSVQPRVMLPSNRYSQQGNYGARPMGPGGQPMHMMASGPRQQVGMDQRGPPPPRGNHPSHWYTTPGNYPSCPTPVPVVLQGDCHHREGGGVPPIAGSGQPNAFHGPQQQGMTAHMNPAFFQSHSPYRFAPCSPRPTNAGMPGPGSGPYHSPPGPQRHGRGPPSPYSPTQRESPRRLIQHSPQMDEKQIEEAMGRNRTVCSSAISRAVSDAAAGEYASAIETLVTAISLLKQSKVAQSDRCLVLISSLQDTLFGIENKSYGAIKRNEQRSRSRERRVRDRDYRDREPYRGNSYGRHWHHDRRDSHYRHHDDRSRSREKVHGKYERSRERERRRYYDYARERSVSHEHERGVGDVLLDKLGLVSRDRDHDYRPVSRECTHDPSRAGDYDPGSNSA